MVSFENPEDNRLVVKRTQIIPQAHLDALKEAKNDSQGRPMGNFHRFASIPTAVVDAWKRQGFDVHKESAKAIVRRLQNECLDTFITTTKAV